MKELNPVNRNILVEMDGKKEKTTASGIIIPGTVEEKPTTGKVLAMSRNIEDPEVSVGDVVLFKKYSGNEVEHEGKKYLLVPYADILAKMVETESI